MDGLTITRCRFPAMLVCFGVGGSVLLYGVILKTNHSRTPAQDDLACALFAVAGLAIALGTGVAKRSVMPAAKVFLFLLSTLVWGPIPLIAVFILALLDFLRRKSK
jgi:hypothetical protein